jgi:hypothetical protein
MLDVTLMGDNNDVLWMYIFNADDELRTAQKVVSINYLPSAILFL